MLNVHKQCECAYGAHRIAWVVCEVNFGKAHMNNKEFYAHNAALIAVLVLGNNGHLGFTHTLQKREQKILLSQREERFSNSANTVWNFQWFVGDVQQVIAKRGG